MTVLPVPEVSSNEPVAVIPTASVAPLDGPPDGERINSFVLQPQRTQSALEESLVGAFAEVREHVLRRPLTAVAAAFACGAVIARLMR